MNIKNRIEKLSNVLAQLDFNIPPVIITQFDPDAFASSLGLDLALRELIRRVNEEKINSPVRIYYCGRIGMAQNRAILNTYDLGRIIKSVSEIKPDTLNTTLLDSSKIKDDRLPNGAKINPKIIIDHHEDSDITEQENVFVWIEKVGATSTLIAELLKELNFNFSDENKHIAALLALGIYTDTKALAGASQRDRNAFGYVTNFVSESEFYQLVHYPLPESHFQNLSIALNNFAREGSRVVLGTEITDPDTADDLSSIADYLLRMRDVSLVAAWGVVETTIRLSVRNNNPGFLLIDFLQDRFGTGGAKITPDGRGEGGALIELDIKDLLMPETEEVVIALVKKWVEAKIFSDQPFSGKEKSTNGNNKTKPD